MPFTARSEGELVTPEVTSSHDTFVCPRCDDEMYLRESYTRSDGTFVARHFCHTPTRSGQDPNEVREGCVGESDEHRRMKSIVASKCKHAFDGWIDSIEIEASISGSRRPLAPPLETGERIIDVAVTFSEDIDAHPRIAEAEPVDGAIGDRLAIEVQYGNKSKDQQATEEDYAKCGFSTLWLYPEQFSDYDVELVRGEGAQWRPIYPRLLRTQKAPPADWTDHRMTFPGSPDNVAVEAAFPVDWFSNELRGHLADTTLGSEAQYERWSWLFPDIATEFVETAEEVLRDHGERGKLLLTTLYPLCDPNIRTHHDQPPPESEVVCGNCFYSESDSYRDDDDAIICWKNQPTGEGNRPRKLGLQSDFAQNCDWFSYSVYENAEVAKSVWLDERLESPRFLKQLARVKGTTPREQRKAALKFAVYQTWGQQDWMPYFTFSPGREEALLRQHDSIVAVSRENDCSTGGDVEMPTPGGQIELSEFL